MEDSGDLGVAIMSYTFLCQSSPGEPTVFAHGGVWETRGKTSREAGNG